MPRQNPDKKLPAKKQGRKRTVDLYALREEALEYVRLQKEVATRNERLKELNAKFKKVVDGWDDNDETHLIIDPKGSRILTVDNVELKQECRTKIEEKPDAIRLIKRRFPKLSSELVETVEVLRMDKLEMLLDEKELTPAQVKQLVTSTDTFALKVKKLNGNSKNK